MKNPTSQTDAARPPDVRRICALVVALAALGTALPSRAGSPLVPIGEGGALFFNASATARYDSNIFLSSEGSQSDTISQLSPGFSLELGKNAEVSTRVVAREDVLYYSSHRDQNDQLGSLEFSANMPGARSSVSFNGAFEQLRQNTRDYRNASSLVRRDQSHANLQVGYELSPKTSFGGGLSYARQDFKDSGFRDDREITVPVNLYYEFSPKIDVSAGYRLRQVRQPDFAGARYDEQFYNVGVRGEFTPKTSGSLQVGLADNRRASGPSENMLGLDGTLTWTATPKISATMLLSRDFRASNSTGESVRSTAASLRAHYAISEFWSAEGTVRYENTSYFAGRGDDFVTCEMLFNYTPSTLVVVSGGCVLESNHSNTAQAGFDRNVLTFSASLRY